MDRVWIISSDHWPRAYLRAELIERGTDAIGYEHVRDAVVDSMMFPSRRPGLIILDLHEQLADEKLMTALFGIGVPVIAIAGATEAAQPPLLDHPWAAILRRPITIGAVVDAMVDAMAREPRAAPAP